MNVNNTIKSTNKNQYGFRQDELSTENNINTILEETCKLSEGVRKISGIKKELS